MESGNKRIGKKIRLILKNGFHYSGEIISEDDLFLILNDKFGKEVQIAKSSLEVLEVME